MFCHEIGRLVCLGLIFCSLAAFIEGLVSVFVSYFMMLSEFPY